MPPPDGRRRVAALLALLVALIVLPLAQSPPPPLVQPGDLIWDGAFRLPYPNTGNSTVGYSGWAIVYSGHDSLYLVGHDYQQSVGEFSIPAGISPTKTTLASLPVATQVQPFASMTHGLPLDAIGLSDSGNYRFGGLLVYGGRLILAEYNSYTTPGVIQKSHWTHSLTTTDATTQATGPWRLAPTTMDPAMTAGYMTLVPSAWQAKLGGPALTGQCCISIIPRTSFGPSAFAFDPATLGTVPEPVPTTPLLYYDEAHQQPDGGFHSDQTTFFNGSTQMAGLFIPEGSRSLLYIGRQGTGNMCYGTVPTNPNSCYTVPPDPYCGDIIHAWPYQIQVWAYDLDDLAAVKAGTKQPWQLRPYAIWPLTGNETATKLPFWNSCMQPKGLTHDPATGRVWLVSYKVDGDRPVVHQFHYATGGQPPQPPPVTYTVTPTTATLPYTGGVVPVTVTASDPAAAWTATSDQAWLTLSSPGGTGSGGVALTAAANPDALVRLATATIAGQRVTVTQDAAPGPPVPPPSSSYAVAYATYLGGSADDYQQHVATDALGQAYVVGGSFGGFPGVSGCGGAEDGIVVKLSAGGARLWARCLGGSAKDYLHSVTTDGQGNVYVAGVTWSPTFPTTPGAFQPTRKGTKDNFVAKYDASGVKLWATLLGGSADEHDRPTLVVDSVQTVWVAGSTSSTDFPTTAGAYSRTHQGGGNDGYVVRLSAAGSSLLLGTFIGGTGNDDLIGGLGLAADGSVSAGGITNSKDLPTTPGAVMPAYRGGGIDGFLVRFDATLATRLAVTYLGGSGDDTVCENHGLSLDGQGRFVLNGQTTSSNLPASAGAFQRTLKGGLDQYVAVVAADGSAIAALTYLGGTGTDLASGSGVFADGRVVAVGYTRSADFPTQAPLQGTLSGAGTLDGTVTVLAPDLSALTFSTYIGGSGDDRSRSVALTPGGAIVVAGDTNSTNFPTVSPSQPARSGPEDYTVVVLQPACSVTVSPLAVTWPAAGGTQTLTIQAGPTCPWTLTGLPSWLTADVTGGTGPGTVTLTAPDVSQAGQITIAGQTIAVTQP